MNQIRSLLTKPNSIFLPRTSGEDSCSCRRAHRWTRLGWAGYQIRPSFRYASLAPERLVRWWCLVSSLLGCAVRRQAGRGQRTRDGAAYVRLCSWELWSLAGRGATPLVVILRARWFHLGVGWRLGVWLRGDKQRWTAGQVCGPRKSCQSTAVRFLPPFPRSMSLARGKKNRHRVECGAPERPQTRDISGRVGFPNVTKIWHCRTIRGEEKACQSIISPSTPSLLRTCC